MLQLKVYSEISKNQDTFLYLEETGSVIRKRKIFKLGKANYYYALIASWERYTNRRNDFHESLLVYNIILAKFVYICDYIRNSFKHLPQKSEIYFFWAHLISVLISFTKCDIMQDLERNYNRLVRHFDFEEELTIIHICSAHMIKAIERWIQKILAQHKRI